MKQIKEKPQHKFNKIYLLLMIILIALILTNIYLITFKPKEEIKIPGIQEIKEEEILKALSVDDYYKTDVNVTVNGLFLTNNCKSLILSVDEFQAYSIDRGIKKHVDFRPTVHDLIEDILQSFKVKVTMAKISEIGEGTYYANLILKQDGKVLNLDSKPSDAVAVAVREDAPIFVKKNLLDEFGVKSC